MRVSKTRVLRSFTRSGIDPLRFEQEMTQPTHHQRVPPIRETPLELRGAQRAFRQAVQDRHHPLLGEQLQRVLPAGPIGSFFPRLATRESSSGETGCPTEGTPSGGVGSKYVNDAA